MRGLDPSNIKDTKRKRQDKFCKFKIENSISNIPKPTVQSSPEKGNKVSIKVSKEKGLMRGLDPLMFWLTPHWGISSPLTLE